MLKKARISFTHNKMTISVEKCLNYCLILENKQVKKKCQHLSNNETDFINCTDFLTKINCKKPK